MHINSLKSLKKVTGLEEDREDLDIEEFKAFIGCLIYIGVVCINLETKATKSAGQMTMTIQNCEQQYLSTDSKS